MKKKDILFQIKSLMVTKKLKLDEFAIKVLIRDKRTPSEGLLKFINYNKTYLDFLGVTFTINPDQKDISFLVSTSDYIGAVPILNSINGLQIGDLIVKPMYLGEDDLSSVVEIMRLIDYESKLEIKTESLALKSGDYFKPPLYFEALKFITALEKLVNKKWTKFRNEELAIDNPSGMVNWDKYAANSYKVENRLKFPSRMNFLNEFHKEYSQMRYVFDICKNELTSSNTPSSIKSRILSTVYQLEKRLYFHKPLILKEFTIKNSESTYITEAKKIGNVIIKNSFIDAKAWRANISDIFEKYAQFIMKKVALYSGRILHSNNKFNSSGTTYHWQLKHLEPDIILQNDNDLIYIDVKYKSNMLGRKERKSDILKESHRHDLHQILAYSSFSSEKSKTAMLIYPAKNFFHKTVDYYNSINGTSIKVIFIGLPFKANDIETNVTEILKVIDVTSDISN